MAAYGVLKDRQAALFVEYDGYWRHGEKEGIDRDRQKNVALLAYAPPGSHVLRISHTVNKPLDNFVFCISVDTWRQGDQKSLSRSLDNVLSQMLVGLEGVLNDKMFKQWQLLRKADMIEISKLAQELANATMLARGGNTIGEISAFLVSEGFSAQDIALMQQKASLNGQSIQKTLCPKLRWFLHVGFSKSQVAKAVARCPQLLRLSIEQNLEPTMMWFIDLGLTKGQFAKAVADHPHILGLSLDQNLERKVHWFEGLGLTKIQIVKTVVRCPWLLSFSIEQNLELKVRCLSDFGFCRSQIAKAIANQPQILGLSIELNLEPTMMWFIDLGLTKHQLAKAVADHPQILGLSLDQNLERKVRWLEVLGLAKIQIAKVVAAYPRMLGYNIGNLELKVQWLLDLGLSKNQTAKTIAGFPQILGLSIEQNLEPTRRFILNMGLSDTEITNAVTTFPQIIGLSLVKNLEPKYELLLNFAGKEEAAKLIAKFPIFFGYRFLRLTERLNILEKRGEKAKLISAMVLTEEAFRKRFQESAKPYCCLVVFRVPSCGCGVWQLVLVSIFSGSCLDRDLYIFLIS